MRRVIIAAALCCGLSVFLDACSDAPPAAERSAMGSASVVFLQAPANLGVFDETIDVRHAADTLYFVGILPGAVLALIQHAREVHREHAVEERRIALSPYTDVIASFDFNARTQAMFSSAVADSPWLHGKQIETVSWTGDEEDYVRARAGEVVVCIRPIYALDPYSNQFIVYVLVGIQQLDPTYPHGIRNYEEIEFNFEHLPMTETPDMTYKQHWQAEQAAESLPHDRALQLWFADGGALLKADFAADLLKVEAGPRKLLRSRPDMPRI
jgi:hypothetical protein